MESVKTVTVRGDEPASVQAAVEVSTRALQMVQEPWSLRASRKMMIARKEAVGKAAYP